MASKPVLTAVPKTAKPTKAGTAVAVKASANIVSIQAQLKAQAEAMGERTAPVGGNQIRVTQDKKFLLPDGSKVTGPLELVVVDFVAKNVFYEEDFDPKNIVPPACFAIGINPLKMVPSKNSPLGQAVDCQVCPNNAFGSKGDGKACGNTRLLAVLPPDADEDTPMWLLSVSATAIKGFDGMVTSVARVFQTPPVGVVLSVGFDDSVTYAKLAFSDPQPNANLAAHFARQEEAKALLMTEPDVSKFVAKAPARKTGSTRR